MASNKNKDLLLRERSCGLTALKALPAPLTYKHNENSMFLKISFNKTCLMCLGLLLCCLK